MSRSFLKQRDINSYFFAQIRDLEKLFSDPDPGVKNAPNPQRL
jgi:hypothetical protein